MFLVHIRFPLVYWNTCIKTITRTCINKIVGDSTRRCKSGLIVTVARFARWDQWLVHNASKSWLLWSSKLFGHWWVCYKYMCITFFMIAETRYVVTKNKKKYMYNVYHYKNAHFDWILMASNFVKYLDKFMRVLFCCSWFSYSFFSSDSWFFWLLVSIGTGSWTFCSLCYMLCCCWCMFCRHRKGKDGQVIALPQVQGTRCLDSRYLGFNFFGLKKVTAYRK